jgi:hypothetical protein
MQTVKTSINADRLCDCDRGINWCDGEWYFCTCPRGEAARKQAEDSFTEEMISKEEKRRAYDKVDTCY